MSIVSYVFQKEKMKKYQVKVEEKVVVNNKKYVQPEEKPKLMQKQTDQPDKPLHEWSIEEQQAQRNQ